MLPALKTVPAHQLATELGVTKVLAVLAHPDDVDFGAAGTIAGLTSSSDVEVSYLLITDGDAGGFEENLEATSLAARRREEQRRAAERVGVTDLEFLGYPDGGVEPSLDLVEKIVRKMREVKADLVIAQHPQRDWTMLQKSHPDHLAAGEAVTRAVYPAVENPYAFPQLAADGYEAFKVQYLMLMAAPEQYLNLRVDITDTVEMKLHALDAHESQHPDVEWMHTRVREQAEAQHPDRDGGAAEVFQLVRVNGPDTFAGF